MSGGANAARDMWEMLARGGGATTQAFSVHESQVMTRLLTALEDGDTDTLKLYAASFAIVVVMLLFVCCSVCFCCNTLFYALERTCCVCRSLFRGLRSASALCRRCLAAVFCCCFGRKSRGASAQRAVCAYGRRKLAAAKGQCGEVRLVARNAAGQLLQTPYCAQHWRLQCARHAVEAHQFETRRSKYTFNLRYAAKGDADVCALVAADVAQARARQRDGNALDDLNSAPGFLYVYSSSVDERTVPLVKRQRYFWKIGMTRKRSAAARVREQDDARFVDRENVGWWSTRGNSALSAEQLVHALLANRRYSRFNADTDQFEIEWFLTTYADAKDAIETVLAAGDNYEALQSPRVCKRFE